MKEQKFEFRKIRDFGEIISDTFVFIGQTWKPLLKAYLTICGFFVLGSLALAIMQQSKMMEFVNDGYTSPFQRMFSTAYFLNMLFSLFTYSSISLTTYCFITLYIEKGKVPPTVEEVWSYFKFYFFRVSFSWILLAIGLIFGFVLCLAPGFYLWPAFSLTIGIMVFENSTLGYAFTRAFQLVNGNYWTILGVIIIISIIIYTAMALFVVPLTIISTSSLLLTGHKLSMVYLILTSVATHVCMIFLILYDTAVAVCYYSISEQKDGTGLLGRIENLGKADPEQGALPTEEY